MLDMRRGPMADPRWICCICVVVVAVTVNAQGTSSLSSATDYYGGNDVVEMPTAFYCPTEGLFADDYDCQIYYRCETKTNDHIKAYALACEPGTVFSRALKLCMPPSMAGREECQHYMNEIDTDEQSLSAGVGPYGSEFPSGDSIASMDKINTQNQLQNYGLSGVGLNGVSVISFSTTPALRSAIAAADNDGPACESDGFMSDPHDCTVFYRCISNGRNFNRIGFRCSSGTAWDDAMQSCSHIQSVRAKGGCSGNGDAIKADELREGEQTTVESTSSHQNSTSSNSSSSSSSSTSTSSSSSSNSSSSSSTQSSQSSSQEQSTQSTQSSNTESSMTASSSSSGNANNQSSNNQNNNSNSNSSGTSSSKPIPSICQDENTYIPDKKDCSKFYRCQDSGKGALEMVPFTCGPGTVWNQQDEACDFPTPEQKDKCKISASSSPPTQNQQQSSTSATQNGSSSSSSNQSGSSSQNQSSGNNSTSTSRPINPDGECKDSETYLPDKTDCTRFYRCVDNGNGFTIVPFDCAPGTVWDADSKGCNHPTDVQKEQCKVMATSGGSGGSQSGSSSATNQQQAGNNQTGSSTSSQQEQSGSNQSGSSSTSQQQAGSSQSGSSSAAQEEMGQSGTSSTTSHQQAGSSQSGSSSSSSSSSSSTESSTTASSSQSSNSNASESSTSSSTGSNNNSTTITSSKPINPDGECKNSETYLPDKTDCTRFYRCVDNGNGFTIVPFDCAPGTVWDPDSKGCNHPTDVQKEQCKVMAAGGGGNNQSGSTSSSQQQAGSSQSGTSSSTQQSGVSQSGTSSSTQQQAGNNQSGSTTTSEQQAGNNQSGSSSQQTGSNETGSSSSQQSGSSQSGSSSSGQHESGSNQQTGSSSSSSSSSSSTESSSTSSSSTSSSSQSTSSESSTSSSSSNNSSSNTESASSSSTSTQQGNETSKPEKPEKPQKPGKPAEHCESEDTFLADKENCSKFYRCVNNGKGGFTMISFDCPPGTIFDPYAGNCDHISAVNNLNCKMSGGSGSGQSQTGVGQGGSSSSSSSSSSANNQWGSSSTQSTTVGENQSSSTSSSSSSSNSSQSSSSNQSSTTSNQSSSSSQTSSQGSTTVNNQASSSSTAMPSSECDGKTEFVGDKTDCAKFYRCVDNGKGNYNRVPFTCGPGTVWDKQLQACNHAWAVKDRDCGTGTSTAAQTITQQSTEKPQTTWKPDTTSKPSTVTPKPTEQTSKPPISGPPQKPSTTNDVICKTDGFIGHPKDCSKFYRCVANGQGGFTQYPFQCGKGTVWDNSLQTCNHDLEKCNTNGGTQSEYEKPTPQPQGPQATTGYPQTQMPGYQTTTQKAQTTQIPGYPTTTQKPETVTQTTQGPGYPTTTQKQEISTQTTQVPGYPTTTQKPEPATQTTTKPPGSTTQYPDTTTMGTTTKKPDPQKPITSNSKCQKEGFFGDEQNCQVFYRCVDNGNGGFEKYKFTCANNTVWDAEIEGCNYPEVVNDPKCRIESTTSEYNPSTTTEKYTSTTGYQTTTVPNKPMETTTYSTTTVGVSTQTTQIPGYNPTTQYPETATQTTQIPGYTTTTQKTEVSTQTTQGPGYPTTTQKPEVPTQTPTKEPVYVSTTQYPDTTTMGTTTKKPDPQKPITSNSKCQKEGFFGDEQNCQVFYRCVNNGNGGFEKYKFTCANNTVWDAEIEGCNYPEVVNDPKCRIESTTSEYYTSTTTEKYTTTTGYQTTTEPSKPTDTTKYPTTTVGYETTTTSTTDNKPSTTTTHYEESTTVESTPTTMSPIPNLPAGTKCQGEGWMADPNNCRKFYRCIRNGDTYSRHEFMCGKGTGWSEAKQTCDHASMVDRCNGQTEEPETTTTSGDSTTTPTTTTKPTDYPSTLPPTKPTTTTTTDYPSTESEKPKPTTTTEISYDTTTLKPGPTTEQPATSSPILNLPPGTECQGEGFMADPYNCRKFYRCQQNGDKLVKHEFTCAKGTGWSEEKQTCDYASNVERCQGQTEEPEIGSTTDSTTTWKPIDTTKPTTVEPPTTTTKEPDTTTTKEPPTTTTKEPPTTTTKEPDTTTTNEPPTTTTTKEPLTTTKEPPTTTTKEPDTTTTKEPPMTTTDYPTTTMEPINYNCTAEGFHPDPEDCNRYYRCVDANKNGVYQIYSFRCPSGTVWDTSLETCNYIDQVSGNCSSGATTTTIKYPTTTGEYEKPTEGTTEPISTTPKPTEQTTTTAKPTQPDTEKPTTTTETVTEDTTTTQKPTEQTTTTPTTETATEPSTTTPKPTEENTEPSTTTGAAEPIDPPPTTQSPTEKPPTNGTSPCPPTAEGQNLFICPTGFRRHPKHCDMFYQCTEKPDTMDMNIVTFQCPRGTVYHEQRNLCDEPAKDEQCLQKQMSRSPFYDDQIRRMNMIQIKQRTAFCPYTGHFVLNDDSCSQLFVKCAYTSDGRLEGQVHRCPEGFAYWSISRRCERTEKLANCSPAQYKISNGIPVDWSNIDNIHRNVRVPEEQTTISNGF